MRPLLLVAVFLLSPLCLLADFKETAARIDALHDQGSYADARALALDAVASAGPHEQAELYWRAARATMELGNEAEDNGEPKTAILKLFDEGEKYAAQAIAADPADNLAYYWKSANIGRWGQVKGILNSLFRAAPMRDLLVTDITLNPDHSDAYYVLGQLYRELHGIPFTFGNIVGAASFGRLAIDTRNREVESGAERKPNYAFYTELGKTLWKRNWSSAVRLSEQKRQKPLYDAAKTALDRGFAYEAVVPLKEISDRQEARELLEYAISGFEKLSPPTRGELKDLKKARDTLAGWK